MDLVEYTLTKKSVNEPNTFALLDLEGPDFSHCNPGQFVIAWVPGKGEKPFAPSGEGFISARKRRETVCRGINFKLVRGLTSNFKSV
jgi:hypothetical protein